MAFFFSEQIAPNNFGSSRTSIFMVLSTRFIRERTCRRYLPARKSAIVRCRPGFLRKVFCASTLSAARCAVIAIAWMDNRAASRPQNPDFKVCHIAPSSSSHEGYVKARQRDSLRNELHLPLPGPCLYKNPHWCRSTDRSSQSCLGCWSIPF